MPADETRLRVTPNLAYGICLVLIGSVLILDRLELLEASRVLRFWPVGLVLVGLTLVIQAFQRVDPGQARDNGFNAGHLIVIAIVGLIVSQGLSTSGVITGADSSERARVFAILGRHQQVSDAGVFRGGDLTSVMGRSELDLRKTSIAPGEEAIIEAFTLMGRATVRVPEEWSVEVRAVQIMGGVRDRRSGARDLQGSPRIVIRGFIMMGGLDIRS